MTRWQRVACAGAALGAMACVAGAMLAEQAMHPPRSAVQSFITHEARLVAGSIQAKEEEVSLEAADGVLLRASWMTPCRETDRAVMLMHGVGDSRLGELGLARVLLREGYAVLALDSRGHGSSGGETVTYGVIEREDVRRWADWLVSHQGVKSLYGLGESMGAAILLQSMPLVPRLRAVVADCPFATFPEVAYDRLSSALPFPSLISRSLVAVPIEAGFAYAWMKHGVRLGLASPLEAMRQSDTPVLLVHGMEDRNILPSHSRELQNARRNRAELWLVPQAGHVGVWRLAGREFEGRILNWFRNH